MNIKHLLTYLFPCLCLLISVKKGKVTFVRRTLSGNNATPVYELLKKSYPDLDITIINDMDKSHGFKWFINKLKLYKELFTSKIIVTTHGPLLKTFKNITIDLWHAFPTKKAGLMLDNNTESIVAKNVDYFLSYSEFSTLLLNSRYGVKSSKFVVLGSPRNDYLFERDNKKKPYFLKGYENCKVVYFLPTNRELRKNSIEEMKRLRFPKFNFDAFNKFLIKNNILFVLKFHPNDEKEWWEALKDFHYSNIILLKEEFVKDGFQDFYQILKFSDILITDYSSSYVDYLLLDNPIIFTPTDLEKYNKDRGLLLEPYAFWRPGPKCITQESLEEELIKCLKDITYYKKERDTIKEIFHKYCDGKSTKRVVDFIYSKLTR